jgi:hypothetical protein
MAFTLTAIHAQVAILINAQETDLPSASIDAIIKNDTLQRFSRDIPARVSADVTGNGTKYYILVGSGTVLSRWVDEFSSIISIEYPAADVALNETPNYLIPDDWRDDYQAGGYTYLRLPNHTPAATEKMRIIYSAPWLFSGSPESLDIPAQYFSAYCYLAASCCCTAISARYSRTNDSTIGADSVNHLSRAQEWANRAKDYMKNYLLWVGNDSEQPAAPAAAFVEIESGPRNPAGARYLYHRKRR